MTSTLNGLPQPGTPGPNSVGSGAIIDGAIGVVDLGTGVQDEFVNTAGDTMTGALTLSGAPTVDLHAATKKYVDDGISGVDLSSKVDKAGDSMTGNLSMGTANVQLPGGGSVIINSGSAQSTLSAGKVDLDYTYATTLSPLNISGDATGPILDVSRDGNVTLPYLASQVKVPRDPVVDDDLARKKYVDTAISGIDLSSRVAKVGDTMSGALIMTNLFVPAGLLQLETGGGNLALSIKQPTDTVRRFSINGSGGMGWGSGAATQDVSISRIGAGLLQMGTGNQIRVQQNPIADNDLARKKYVDDTVAGVDLTSRVAKAGDTMTGNLLLHSSSIMEIGESGTGTSPFTRISPGSLEMRKAGDAFNAFQISPNGNLSWQRTTDGANDASLTFNAATGRMDFNGTELYVAADIFMRNTGGKSIYVGDPSGNTTGGFIHRGATSSAVSTFASKLTGDGQDRFAVKGDGKIELGSGAATADWSMARVGANVAALSAGDKLQQNAPPTVDDDLANKKYVDDKVAAADTTNPQQYVTATGATALSASARTIVFNNTGGAATLTLPASPAAGRRVDVSRRAAGGGNTVTVDGNGKTINGIATYVLNSQYSSVTIEYSADVNEWMVL